MLAGVRLSLIGICRTIRFRKFSDPAAGHGSFALAANLSALA